MVFEHLIVLLGGCAALACWVRVVYCYRQALRHPAAGVPRTRTYLWNDEELSSRGLEFRRRGTRAFVGLVAAVLGTLAAVELLRDS